MWAVGQGHAPRLRLARRQMSEGWAVKALGAALAAVTLFLGAPAPAAAAPAPALPPASPSSQVNITGPLPNMELEVLPSVSFTEQLQRQQGRTDRANAAIPRWTADGAPPPAGGTLAPKAMAGAQKSGAQTMTISSFSILSTAPDEIQELARALKHDPDLIYEYVYSNIKTDPIYGSLKGPIGALTDGHGTAFDQAELMVVLLQEAALYNTAISNPQYQFGEVWLNRAQLMNWLGADNGLYAISGALSVGGFPHTRVSSGSTYTCARVGWVWVQVAINGVTYYFDPASKLSRQSLTDLQNQQANCAPSTAAQPAALGYVRTAGVNLATATGYDQTTFLNRARTGATITTTSVSGLNRTNVRADLATYSNNLVSWIKANKPAASTADIVGGAVVNGLPVNTQQRWTALPYLCTNSPCVAPTTSATIPASYRTTLGVTLPGATKVTFNTADIYGRRLTVVPNGSNQPVLALDGVTQSTGSPVSPGANLSVGINIIHPVGNPVNSSLSTVAGSPFLIGQGWGQVGRGMIERHRKLLLKQQAANPTDFSSEAVLGESLAVLSYTWLAETAATMDMIDAVSGTSTIYRHAVGVVGYKDLGGGASGPFVDLPFNRVGIVQLAARPNVGATPKESTVFFAISGMSSILESGVLEQTNPGTSALSTVKLLDMASQSDTIYDINNSAVPGNDQAYWTSTIKPLMTPYYGAQDLNRINSLVVSSNLRVVAALHGQQTVNLWTGSGYFQVTQNGGSIGAIITGGLSGGVPSQPTPKPLAVKNTATVSKPPPAAVPATIGSAGKSNPVAPKFADPVSLLNGAFLYDNDDLNVGSASFPYGLTFGRHYDSNARLSIGAMGAGWSHNFEYSAVKDSDGFSGLGLESPISGSSAIATLFILQDVLNLQTGTEKPLDRLIVAVQAERWLMDQLTDNVVNVSQPDTTEQFVKLADGTFKEPHGSSGVLTQIGGLYVYKTGGGDQLNFNVAGNLSTLQFKSGPLVTLSYDGANRLTSVGNGMGRSLALTYTGDLVANVSDGTRSVTYSYDSSKNLTAFQNAAGDSITYVYDQPGRITQVFYPSFPAVAFVSNTYGLSDRVNEQLNASGQVTKFYVAGSRSEARDPYDAATTTYFTSTGREKLAINALGNQVASTYDGVDRLVRKTRPEGDRVDFQYDNSYPASAVVLQNLLAVTSTPKPGSPLTPAIHSYTYDTQCRDRLKTSTNANGATTSYLNDAVTCNRLEESQPTVDGQTPKTIYTYNARGQVLTTTDALGKVTLNTYDSGTESLLSVVDDSGGLNLSIQFGYDAVGNLTSLTDQRGHVTTTLYNSMRWPTQITGPASTGMVTKTNYSPDGLVTKVERATGDPAGPWQTTTAAFAASGNKLSETDAKNQVTVFTYDALDRLLTVTDPQGRVTANGYDLLGQLTSVSNPAIQPGPLALYAYSANGMRASFTDSNGNLTAFIYDGFDRLAQTRFPVVARGAGQSDVANYEAVLAYDAVGNPLQIRKRSGDVITLTYDVLNRARTKQFPGALDNVYIGYDLNGRILYSRYNSVSGLGVDYTYDSAGRMATERSRGAGFDRTLSYLYDAAGNRTRITWPDGFYAEYAFDGANRVTSIGENGATSGVGLLASYTYDPLGRIVSIARGNGASTSAQYDASDNPLLISHVMPPAGASKSVALALGYTVADQLASRNVSNIAYDFSGFPVGTHNATADGLNRDAATAALAGGYDGNGNLGNDGARTFTYDFENRLKSVTQTGGALSLAYDPAGRLQQQVATVAGNAVTTQFLYDGLRLVGEYSAAGVVLRRYVQGPGLDAPVLWYEGSSTADRRWLHADERGSIIAQSSSVGVVTQVYTYGPYGEPGGWSGSRFAYTGQVSLPEAQLYHFRARAYDPAAGRFLQTDPIGYVGGANLYSYADNDPLNLADPLGTSSAPVLTQFGSGFVTGLKESNTLQISAPAKPGAAGWAGYATGSAAAGLVGLATEVGVLGGLKKLGQGVQTVKALVPGVQGIYQVVASTGKTYVGQSVDVAKRIGQHVASGKVLSQDIGAVKTMQVLGGKTAREIAEQGRINALGGIKNLENKINPIGKSREHLLPKK